MRAVLFLVMLLVSSQALGLDQDAEGARIAYQRAVKAFALQDWPSALNGFREAYLLHPTPDLLFDIAQCQRQMGEYDAAARSYRSYAAQSPQGAHREQAQRLAEQMDRAVIAQAAPPIATPAMQSPAAAEAKRSPTPALVAPVPTPAIELGARPTPRRRRWTHRPGAMTLAGASIAGIGVGIALLALGASDHAAARDARTLPDQRELGAQASLFYDGGAWALAAGTAAAIGAGFLFRYER